MTESDTPAEEVGQWAESYAIKLLSPMATITMVLSYIGIGVAGLWFFLGLPLAQEIWTVAITAGVVGLMGDKMANGVKSL